MTENNSAKEIDVDALSDEEASKMMAEMEAAAEASEIAAREDTEQVGEAKAAEPEPEAPADTKAEEEGKAPEQEQNGAPADDGEEKPTPEKQDAVSHQRFHYERERRKELESKYEKAQERENILLERMEKLMAIADKPGHQAQPEEPTLPAPEDPVGRVNYVFDKIQQQEQAAQEARAQQTQAEQEMQAINAAYERANVSFAQGGEEAQSAMEALKESYVSEYRALGYSDQQIVETYPQLEAQHVLAAETQGVNIVDYIKSLAAARGWSYTPAEQQTPPSENINVQSEAEKLAARELAREKSMSLGAGGGTSVNTGSITAEQLADMSEKDFGEYLEKNGSVIAAMGGG